MRLKKFTIGFLLVLISASSMAADLAQNRGEPGRQSQMVRKFDYQENLKKARDRGSDTAKSQPGRIAPSSMKLDKFK